MAKKVVVTKDFDYDPIIPGVKRGHVTSAYRAGKEAQTLPDADAQYAIEKGYATEEGGKAAKAEGQESGGGKAKT